MKKTYFLTLLTLLCSIATAWAQFNPNPRVKYALQEITSGLYLDIQTLGSNKDEGTDNISLSYQPCVVYFEKGSNTGTWKMKNVNEKYVYFNNTKWEDRYTGDHWNPKIGDSAHDWIINEVSVEGKALITIARDQNTYINTDNKSSGSPLFCDQPTGMQLALVKYNDLYRECYALKSPTGTYFNFTEAIVESLTTAASFQSAPSYLYMIPSGDGAYVFQNVENKSKFIGTSVTYSWLATTDAFAWNVSEPDENGYVAITKKTASGEHLGHNKSSEVGTAIFTNGDATTFKWLIEKRTEAPNVEYVLYIDSPQGESVIVKYGEETVSNKHIFNTDVDLSLFTATDIEGYTWKVVLDEENYVIILVYTEVSEVQTYTFQIVDAPTGITVTYNNIPVEDGGEIIGPLDETLFQATPIKGYVWNIVVDETQKTITLVYTVTRIEENPEAVVALIKRIGGADVADKFKFVLDPDLNTNKESFMLGSEDGKILIKGTTISAITTGIGWYLNNVAHINIAWNSLNERTAGAAYVNLPADLPLPAAETHTTDAKYRYYLNYCTFGYSMTTWTWERWQKEIDWMALHGVNMPLQIIGLEEVWRKFLTLKDGEGNSKYNYSDEEAKAFVAGPAFTAWWGMNNLEGWGGTGADGWGGVQDDAWYARQQELATRILTLERALGMEPVLPGFSGMVPSNFTDKTGITTDDNGGAWNSFTRPHIIDPKNARFAGIASDYYACLTEVMGTSQYYSMDPFHEGGSYNGNYGDAYRAIYDAMNIAKPNSQWVIQQWQWWDTERKKQAASLDAVPEGKLIVLDLFSDGMPQFGAYRGYDPQHAVFCAIPNFGGRSGLMGRLQNVTDNYFKFKGEHTTIKGIGAAPEAIEQTPITYDLVFQLPWMDSKPNVAEWVANYAVIRYGQDNAIVKEAWDLLRQGPLNYGADGIQGPIEDVWAARPNLDGNPSSSWGTTLSTIINNEGLTSGDIYTPARRQMLADAVYKLLSQEQALGLAEGSIYESNYLYDLVEFGSAVMADYAHDLLLGIGEARSAGDNALYETRRDAFLQLILDMDDFKGTNLNFRLGKWTEEARAAAEEVEGWETKNTADWYEFNNARTLITTWGDRAQNGNGNWNDGLKDYSYRSWQGLLKDYYYPRWAYYFEHDCTHPDNYFFFEWNWAHGMTHEVGDVQKSTTRLTEGDAGYSYTREPEEKNTVSLAQGLLDDYIIPVTAGNGVYYAYRYLDNDMTNQVTIPAEAGSSIDLTEWFGAFTDVTITGDVIDGTVTNLNSVAINAGSTDGKHTVTLTCSDGTAFLFSVMVNPSYYGAYYIQYKNDEQLFPVFIGYHDKKHNNDDGIGYKLITPSESVRATAAADEIFTITPHAGGYSISAQGKYLQQPAMSSWNHLMFSDDKADAGVYLFEDTQDGLLKIRGSEDGINYVNSYGEIFGNDYSTTATSTFTIERAETYPLTIPASGVTTLYLPFNVVLPEGVSAYDINEITDNNEAVLIGIAAAGHTLKKGTPVIIKGRPGDNYNLAITMSNANARGSMANSLLRGTYVKQTVTPGGKYQLNGNGLSPIASNVDITNGCWVEWGGSADNIPFVALDYITVGEWKLKFEVNAEEGLTLTEHTQAGENELVIPATYIIDGVEKSITALADGFLSGTNIISIVLPETLEQMGNLSGCTSLQSVTFTSNPTFNVKDKVAGGVELHLLLDDSKAVDFNAATANTFDRITYRRRLPDGVYGSILLPFTPDATSLEHYAFYAQSSSTSESLIFAEVKSPRANVPYIYTKKIVGTAADITGGITTIANPSSLNTNNGSWVTVGCYENATITVNSSAYFYGISSADNQFYHVTGRIKAKPYRAYFKNTDTSKSAAPKLTMRLADGDTTEIEVEHVDGKHNGTIYDLQGRPVTTPTKGLYIVNGNKVIYK